MKICSECGARNADHSFLCNQCGKPLEVADEAESTGDTDQIPPQQAATADDLVSEATDRLSEGQASEAIGLCERALELRAEYVPAFALLGMAHEEVGNLQAALSAYENVLRIDPSRSVERRKVNLIKLQMMRGDRSDTPEATQRSRWSRYAPILLAVGAALLVFALGAWLIVNNRAASEKQVVAEAYEAAMRQGNEAVAEGDYDAAVAHFQAALEVQPGDGRALTRMRRARKMMNQDNQAAASLPRYIPSKGPNPFQPVVVPGKNDQQQDSATDAGPAVPVPDPTTNRPRSVYRHQQGSSRSTSDSSSGQSQATSTTADQGANEQEPISPVPSRPRPQPDSETAPPPGRDGASSEEDPGEIRIWASDQPAPDSGSASSDGSVGNPDALRAKADRMRRQGNCDQATGYYSQAIEGYRQRMENQPALSESARKAIESCQTGKELCETE